jgi:hypothetical protein
VNRNTGMFSHHMKPCLIKLNLYSVFFLIYTCAFDHTERKGVETIIVFASRRFVACVKYLWKEGCYVHQLSHKPICCMYDKSAVKPHADNIFRDYLCRWVNAESSATYIDTNRNDIESV